MPSNDSGSGSQCLFLALWPDAAVRCAVANLVWQWVSGGRQVPVENLHITLAFLGNVPGAVAPRLVPIGVSLIGSGFVLELDRIGYWPRQRISWIAPSRTPVGMVRLHRTLRRALGKAGFSIPDRRFVPHMTLARRSAPHAFHNVIPVIWPVDCITVVRSYLEHTGARYEILYEWPLQPENIKGWISGGGGMPPGNME